MSTCVHRCLPTCQLGWPAGVNMGVNYFSYNGRWQLVLAIHILASGASAPDKCMYTPRSAMWRGGYSKVCRGTMQCTKAGAMHGRPRCYNPMGCLQRGIYNASNPGHTNTLIAKPLKGIIVRMYWAGHFGLFLLKCLDTSRRINHKQKAHPRQLGSPFMTSP